MACCNAQQNFLLTRNNAFALKSCEAVTPCVTDTVVSGRGAISAVIRRCTVMSRISGLSETTERNVHRMRRLSTAGYRRVGRCCLSITTCKARCTKWNATAARSK